jgi:hypothetical protein
MESQSTAARRIASVVNTLNPPKENDFLFTEGTSSVGKKSDDDVVIVSYVSQF